MNPKTRDIELLHRSVSRRAMAKPDHPAMICDGRITTYSELNDNILRTAGAFTRMGVGAADRIAIDTSSAVVVITASAAAFAIGAIPVLLSGKTLSDFRYIIDDCKPQLIVAASSQAGEEFVDLGPEILVPYELEKHNVSDSPERLGGRAEPEDIAMILYTSGTTSGVRKGVVQPYKALQATAEYITDIMRIEPDIVEYVASPIDTAFGFGRCRVVLRRGGTVVFNSGILNPARLVGAISKYGCNSIAGDSAIFAILLQHFEKHLATLASTLKWIKIASQPLPAEGKNRLLFLLPEARIFMNYGLTEAMRCTIISLRDFPEKIESTGRPCPGVDIMIVDENGTELGPHEVGEIKVTGDNLAVGYLNKESLWKAVVKDGWYHTGDLGRLDENRFLYVLGRKDDIVNIGGRKVAPEEVENLLGKFLINSEFAVCGIDVPDDPMGQCLALFVRKGTEIDLPKLRQRLSMLVEEYKIPRRLYEVTRIPTTDNGKIQRRELVKMIADKS